MTGHERSRTSAWLRSRVGLVMSAFLAIAAFFLVTEHTAHFFGILPYLLLLACPLLHQLMHGGRSGHAGHGSDHKHGPEGDKNG